MLGGLSYLAWQAMRLLLGLIAFVFLIHTWRVTQTNNAYQRQCVGCLDLERKLHALALSRKSNTRLSGAIGPIAIHKNLKELRECAASGRCKCCSLLLHALLLEQVTWRKTHQLEQSDLNAPVLVKILCSIEQDALCVWIDDDRGLSPQKKAIILLTDAPIREFPPGSQHRTNVHNALDNVVRTCRDEHKLCNSLSFSKRNPKYLIDIRADKRMGMWCSAERPLESYVTLSYTRGSTLMTEHEKRQMEDLERATERRVAQMKIDGKRQYFQLSELPWLMKDAISIAKELGASHIWIDILCIPTSDWNKEASKMHEVYGNALFTLYAVASECAQDRLLPVETRDAWQYAPLGECKVAGLYLYTLEPSLETMRLAAPISRRGWTLQEERLSPRILYWGAQRSYWSCASDPATQSQISSHRDMRSELWKQPSLWNYPQSFLKRSFIGSENDELDQEWLDLVASFVRRGLTYTDDRFPAVSGLALRYLTTKPYLESSEAEQDEYLAGLWRGSFARGLSWSVEELTRECLAEYPSWSWASLPMPTNITYPYNFTGTDYFSIVTEQSCGSDAYETIQKGAAVKSIKVRGRVKPFTCSDALYKQWVSNSITSAQDACHFFENPERAAYACNKFDGRVATYEPHKETVVAQLDSVPAVIHFTEESQEVRVLCLEVGKQAMLLLHPKDQERSIYCRIGAASGFRPDFFSGAVAKELSLV